MQFIWPAKKPGIEGQVQAQDHVRSIGRGKAVAKYH
jgi:hypothetical protein